MNYRGSFRDRFRIASIALFCLAPKEKARDAAAACAEAKPHAQITRGANKKKLNQKIVINVEMLALENVAKIRFLGEFVVPSILYLER